MLSKHPQQPACNTVTCECYHTKSSRHKPKYNDSKVKLLKHRKSQKQAPTVTEAVEWMDRFSPPLSGVKLLMAVWLVNGYHSSPHSDHSMLSQSPLHNGVGLQNLQRHVRHNRKQKLELSAIYIDEHAQWKHREATTSVYKTILNRFCPFKSVRPDMKFKCHKFKWFKLADPCIVSLIVPK